jgi:hypothetical protein
MTSLELFGFPLQFNDVYRSINDLQAEVNTIGTIPIRKINTYRLLYKITL